MLFDLRVFQNGIDSALEEISKLRDPVGDATRRGLVNAARRTYAEAMKLLKGPGRTPVRTRGKREWNATGYRNINPTRIRTTKDDEGNVVGMHSFLGARPGSYPVPIITGHLRGRLAFVEPGETKSAGGVINYNVNGTKIKKNDPALSVHATEDEVIIFDSAVYANRIHETRPFIQDGFHRYGGVDQVVQDIEDELQPLFGE